MNVKTGHASLAQTRTTMGDGKKTGKAAGYLCREGVFAARVKKKKKSDQRLAVGGTQYSVAPGRSSRRRNGCAERACICSKHTGLAFRYRHTYYAVHTHGPTEDAETDGGRARERRKTIRS